MTTTQWASVLLGLGVGGLIWDLLWTPGRWAYRWLWKHMPDGRLKSALLKEREGKWITIHTPKRRPDQ